MNEYRKRDTGDIITEAQFRASHDNVAFPLTLNQYVFDAYGIDPVMSAPKPNHTEFQSVMRSGAVQDANGNWVQAWQIIDWTQEQIDKHLLDKASREREAAKLIRDQAVAAIKVTVNGKVFDGDERSQDRMARAILVNEITGISSAEWTLADNSRVTITVEELKQALALAALEQNNLWPIEVGE